MFTKLFRKVFPPICIGTLYVLYNDKKINTIGSWLYNSNTFILNKKTWVHCKFMTKILSSDIQSINKFHNINKNITNINIHLYCIDSNISNCGIIANSVPNILNENSQLNQVYNINLEKNLSKEYDTYVFRHIRTYYDNFLCYKLGYRCEYSGHAFCIVKLDYDQYTIFQTSMNHIDIIQGLKETKIYSKKEIEYIVKSYTNDMNMNQDMDYQFCQFSKGKYSHDTLNVYEAV